MEIKMNAVHLCCTWILSLTLFCAIIGSGKASAVIDMQKRPDKHPSVTEILIRFKHDTSFLQRQAFSAKMGITQIRSYDRFRINLWQLPQSTDNSSLEQLLTKLRRDPAVEWAEPNYRRYPQELPDDTMFGSQWHLENTGQSGGTPGADIQAVEAWEITTGNSNVVVAILDSGVDYNHPDLQDNMWKNLGEDWTPEGTLGHNGIDDDGNGYIDDYYGIDAGNNSGDPMDGMGHGTHVAGIVGAVGNNGVGISGINWQVQLMALQFLSPDGSVADEIECISYILDQKEKGVPVRVVNASFGGTDYSRFEKEAIESLMSAGIMMAAAVGNDGAGPDAWSRNYPAEYGLKNIISVAATDNQDKLAYFSNYGFHTSHIGAPGLEILSTYLSQSYDSLSGTSMAAPQVTGALALLNAQRNPDIDEARERILRGVDENAYLYGQVFSNGRLNIYKALTVELQGPFIFSISPTSGSAGVEVTITGVRFGNGDSPECRVTFGDTEATVRNWSDNSIVCLIPHGSVFSPSETTSEDTIRVHNASGVSNEVLFDIDPYRYFLPFAPATSPWVSHLILCNYSLETVNPRVFAGPSGAWTIEPQTEVLYSWQVIYRNLKDYGLSGEKNLLWVESEKDIGVELILINLEFPGMTLVPSHQR